jgi:type I restriction-modification system DNA methylase subunit
MSNQNQKQKQPQVSVIDPDVLIKRHEQKLEKDVVDSLDKYSKAVLANKAYKSAIKNKDKPKSKVLIKMPWIVVTLVLVFVAIMLRHENPKTIGEVYENTIAWVLCGVSIVTMVISVYKEK